MWHGSSDGARPLCKWKAFLTPNFWTQKAGGETTCTYCCWAALPWKGLWFSKGSLEVTCWEKEKRELSWIKIHSILSCLCLWACIFDDSWQKAFRMCHKILHLLAMTMFSEFGVLQKGLDVWLPFPRFLPRTKHSTQHCLKLELKEELRH